MPMTEREKLHRLQNGICAYCGNYRLQTLFTVDHVIPLSKGGRNAKRNKVGACLDCNREKADRLPTMRELVQVIKAKTRGNAAHDLEPRIYLAMYYQGELVRITGKPASADPKPTGKSPGSDFTAPRGSIGP